MGGEVNTNEPSQRWVVDSRLQLEQVAARIYKGEIDSRAKKAAAMRARKKHNTSTSINNEGFGGGQIEYVSDFMRSFNVDDINKGEKRDPFQDLKRAKALKKQLQKSQIDLGSGFGGGDREWITDKQAGQLKVDTALSSGEFKGRNPMDDKRKAQALKKYEPRARRAPRRRCCVGPRPRRCCCVGSRRRRRCFVPRRGENVSGTHPAKTIS
jgi:hypothetical protein